MGYSNNNSPNAAGLFVPKSVEQTRPADVTPYIAQDVVGMSPAANLIFDIGLTPGNHGWLTKAILKHEDPAAVWRARVHLFTTAPTPIADNAQFDMLYATPGHVEWFDFPGLAKFGASSDCAKSIRDDLRAPFRLSAADTQLYVVITTLDAWTPLSAKRTTLELFFELY